MFKNTPHLVVVGNHIYTNYNAIQPHTVTVHIYLNP